MWQRFSSILLRNRLVFTLLIVFGTAFMAYETSKLELSYEFAKILPEDDSTFMAYNSFKNYFGEDGNVMVVGMKDPSFFQLDKFNDWFLLSMKIKKISGIKEVMSLPLIYRLQKNEELEKLDFISVMKSPLANVKELVRVKDEITALPFYEGILYNKAGSHLMAITFQKKDLDSKRRISIVNEIKTLCDAFSRKYMLELHYSGMPYIRTQYMARVSHEMVLFLALAIFVTAIILWLFFRSPASVLFSLAVVVIGVIWSVGILQLFGYKITVLSGLIAPLMMVIGLPNCIFLINKYHSEFALHGNKMKALSRTIETIGVTLFLANVTTAIGFGVLFFTNSSLLVEFGVVAAIGVIATYLITLILIPIIFSILPEPQVKYTKHLKGKRIQMLLNMVGTLVLNYRKPVYVLTAAITIISFVGMQYINIESFVVDDLPRKDPIYSDLRFFETEFKGVLPFEISIDTKKENGVFSGSARTLYKIKALQKVFANYPEFSKPVSVVEAIKFSYQAYKGGDPKFYKLPAVTDLKRLTDYAGSLKGQDSKLKTFLDTNRQITRVSYQIADIGSNRMKDLLNLLHPRIDSIFPPQEYNVSLTGHSLVFLKSNDYLLSNLLESLLIEIVLIALVGLALFRSLRIIIFSKIPCLIPLIITAGVMGFLDIHFKPSTILIFSIAFGISSDGTVYFLTRYRHELKSKKTSVKHAISETIMDTGLSMIYTTVILFCGFAIFAASSFDGTIALGVLVSLTLLISLCTNLILLPCILISIEKRKSKKLSVKSISVPHEEQDYNS